MNKVYDLIINIGAVIVLSTGYDLDEEPKDDGSTPFLGRDKAIDRIREYLVEYIADADDNVTLEYIRAEARKEVVSDMILKNNEEFNYAEPQAVFD